MERFKEKENHSFLRISLGSLVMIQSRSQPGADHLFDTEPSVKTIYKDGNERCCFHYYRHNEFNDFSVVNFGKVLQHFDRIHWKHVLFFLWMIFLVLMVYLPKKFIFVGLVCFLVICLSFFQLPFICRENFWYCKVKIKVLTILYFYQICGKKKLWESVSDSIIIRFGFY